VGESGEPQGLRGEEWNFFNVKVKKKKTVQEKGREKEPSKATWLGGEKLPAMWKVRGLSMGPSKKVKREKGRKALKKNIEKKRDRGFGLVLRRTSLGKGAKKKKKRGGSRSHGAELAVERLAAGAMLGPSEAKRIGQQNAKSGGG